MNKIIRLTIALFVMTLVFYFMPDATVRLLSFACYVVAVIAFSCYTAAALHQWYSKG